MLNEIIKMIELSKNTKGQDWRHNINQIKIKINEYAKEYHESKVKKLNIPDVMVELACPRCGSTNTAPSDKENDAGCYECGFVWQDN